MTNHRGPIGHNAGTSTEHRPPQASAPTKGARGHMPPKIAVGKNRTEMHWNYQSPRVPLRFTKLKPGMRPTVALPVLHILGNGQSGFSIR